MYLFVFSIFHLKSGTTNNLRNGSSDISYWFHDILPYSNLPYANLPYTILSYIPIYPIPIYPIPFYPIIKAIETYPILLKNPKQYVSEQIKEPLIMIKE